MKRPSAPKGAARDFLMRVEKSGVGSTIGRFFKSGSNLTELKHIGRRILEAQQPLQLALSQSVPLWPSRCCHELGSQPACWSAFVLDNIPWNSASYLVVFLFTLTPSISEREIALIAQGFEQTKVIVKQGNKRIASEFMGQTGHHRATQQLIQEAMKTAGGNREPLSMLSARSHDSIQCSRRK